MLEQGEGGTESGLIGISSELVRYSIARAALVCLVKCNS